LDESKTLELTAYERYDIEENTVDKDLQNLNNLIEVLKGEKNIDLKN